MSASHLDRIMAETTARLATASYGEETRTIGLDHSRRCGAHQAERVYFRILELQPLTNAETNSMILQGMDLVAEACVATFEAHGAANTPDCDVFTNASVDGFLDRMEDLLENAGTWGRA